MKKKVTFLFTRYFPVSNGVGNCTRSMAQALAGMGYDVDVITCRLSPDAPRFEILNGVRVHRILSFTRRGSRSLSILTFFLWEWIVLLRELKRIQPDYVFGMMLYYGCIVDLLKTVVGCKSITLSQGSDVDEVTSPLQHYTVRRAIKGCDIVCATNSEFREKMIRFYPRSDIHILQNCIGDNDVSITSYPARFDPTYLHAICVGRMVYINGIETKGMSYAIRAVARLEHVMLHLFGDGPYRATLEQLAVDLGVDARVRFHGEIPHPQLCDAMKKSDILLLPSMTEGLSKTIIEASYLGLPIVCTRIGGQRDFLVHAESALFVKRGSAGSIAAALSAFMASEKLRQKLRQGASSVFNRHFTYDAFGAKFEEILATHMGHLESS